MSNKILKYKLKKLGKRNVKERGKINNFPGYYNLFHINIKNNKTNNNDEKYILNNFEYKKAIKYDDRSFWRISWIYLLNSEKILHTFFFKSDIEPFTLRLCFFIFNNSCNFALNAVFYFNNKISDRYQYSGDNLYLYSFINNITITITSTFISYGFMILFKWLINGRYKIEGFFIEEEKKLCKKK